MGRSERASYPPTTPDEERAAAAIVDAAFTVHKTLGPGLLENVYEVCFCRELTDRGLTFARQVVIPIVYRDISFDEGLRLDGLVDDLVICELKAVETMHPVFTAQLLTYMKLAQKRLGFLVNFNVPTFKHGIMRMIL